MYDVAEEKRDTLPGTQTSDNDHVNADLRHYVSTQDPVVSNFVSLWNHDLLTMDIMEPPPPPPPLTRQYATIRN